MSIFGKLKDAILGDRKEETRPVPPAQDKGSFGKPLGGTGTASAGRLAPTPAPTPAPARAASIDSVDVERRLDARPGADKLNWRTSIVDLMKLVGVDSSYDNRKELAQELGRSDYSGSAEDNIWLHKATMRQIAQNGGRVPASMTD
ncbi:DUF3597 domain-containing protein [Croceicoccus sp. YJ47]|uniref:DUF3597 domain-containing protein n=1 Tax=Croceicoccus sp. YJ47 TaxID=2798724 RepID=UPI00192065E6|nr:DUF3597 domain-containing protein [Croceicoccus sp. YJ47]QQN74855.1 DUF3597 domain-containing protein [Croceicoccus sp. YJ47]